MIIYYIPLHKRQCLVTIIITNLPSLHRNYFYTCSVDNRQVISLQVMLSIITYIHIIIIATYEEIAIVILHKAYALVH